MGLGTPWSAVTPRAAATRGDTVGTVAETRRRSRRAQPGSGATPSPDVGSRGWSRTGPSVFSRSVRSARTGKGGPPDKPGRPGGAQGTAGDDRDGLRDLFVAVMIWGSGTTNGRGPRHTDAALSDTRIQAAPRTTRDSVRSGDLRLVYSQFVLAGVRRSFATKWLAAVDDRGSGEARALIPDDRVFRSLNALGWSGRKAAGTRHWPTRYATCVSAMHGWAGSIGVTAEWLEWLLSTSMVRCTRKSVSAHTVSVLRLLFPWRGGVAWGLTRADGSLKGADLGSRVGGGGGWSCGATAAFLRATRSIKLEHVQ
ncbi:hypothetical protein ACIGJO_33965 [Streptomyces sp. NPDC079020]|uniref:8-oxoguanine DNA glycosylase OGG fold protein n=1 Tax=Streptomyces sp. NPDC079020 TaxID=3365722 RepID=UPI0037D30C68